MLTSKQGMETVADREPLLRQFDGRLEQPGPGQLAVRPMRHLEHAHGPRDPDRTPANHGFGKTHRLAVRAQEESFIDRRRCGFAPIVGFNAFAVGMDDERAAPHPARLRLDQRQHQLHGHRRVDGTAPGAEDGQSRRGGMRVGGGNGRTLESPAGFFNIAGSAFGRDGMIGNGRHRPGPGRIGGEDRREDGRHARHHGQHGGAQRLGADWFQESPRQGQVSQWD